MTIQLDVARPRRTHGGAPERVLMITASDSRAARRVARVVEDVRGAAPELLDALTVRVTGVDAKAAVDVLAELAWAGATPEAFSLS